MQIVFIGGGNMAGALIGGLRKAGHAAQALHVVERDEQTARTQGERLGVPCHASLQDAPQQGDAVVLAVKPSDLRPVAEALRPKLNGRLVVSIAAGIPSEALARWCGSEAIVRAMPNTPALVGLGMTGLYARAAVTPAQRALAEAVLGAVGKTMWLQAEEQIDAVTAISGSGPAYVFLVMEAMQAAGERLGLAPVQVRELVLATFAGATALAEASPESPGTLRERVTSKGGTTAAALEQLRAGGLEASFDRALQAAARRAAEMARELAGD
jgi:pyrroline-5-carboxylate reductase